MTIDEWATTLSVFVVVTGVFTFLGPWAYRAANGSPAFLADPKAHFEFVAFMTSALPGGALMLAYALPSLPLGLGYVIGVIIVTIGCVAGSAVFKGMIQLLVVMNVPTPDEEEDERIKMAEYQLRLNELARRRKRRKPKDPKSGK